MVLAAEYEVTDTMIAHHRVHPETQAATKRTMPHLSFPSFLLRGRELGP